jgi:DNA polymerase III delta prime subunit
VNKIFSVNSLVRNFPYQGKHYEEVKVNWFVLERKNPLVPYATAIQDYEQLDEKERAFPEEYVNEQFSHEEAGALRKYLDRQPATTTQIETIELPVMPNVSGCRRLPAGGGNDFLPLHRGKGYSLPFKVEGYFSVRYAEPMISGDERATVIHRRP